MAQQTIPTADWKLAEPAPREFLERFPEYPAVVAQLLHNRGLRTDAEIERFRNPAYPSDFHDPFALGGMRQAVSVIGRALDAREQIVVHGDYDADGLTAAALLADALTSLGGVVDTFVPSRYEEGYGVAPATLGRLQQDGARLVVTVDCGISDAAAIEQARRSGLRVVVTDHHVPPERVPDADAVVNPNLPDDPYPNKALTGAGVAFKLAQALFRERVPDAAERERLEKWLLDLAAIGTVADMAELRGENRALVTFGLLVLEKTKRPGLRQLIRQAGVRSDDLSTERIGYAIAPRLNAPGRIDHARDALQLLVTDSDTEARRLAEALERINQQRQRLTLEAVEGVREELAAGNSAERLIFLDGDWRSGVVGLVAGRLVRDYARPAVVVERGERFSRGSVRSVPAFHVAEALQAHGELLESFGGHAQAGGFTVATDKLDVFRKKLQAFARQSLDDQALRPELAIEARLDPDEFGWDLMEHLEGLEPFGLGNPKPLLLLSEVTLESSSVVGRDQSHLKLRLRLPDGRRLDAVAFGLAARRGELKEDCPLDVAGSPVVNEFNGSRSLEWRVEDFRAA